MTALIFQRETAARSHTEQRDPSHRGVISLYANPTCGEMAALIRSSGNRLARWKDSQVGHYHLY